MVFFVKQKTAYEMRISDWSSDVCSSDLLYSLGRARGDGRRRDLSSTELFLVSRIEEPPTLDNPTQIPHSLMKAVAVAARHLTKLGRSEERRVGKECVSTFRSRWSPYH